MKSRRSNVGYLKFYPKSNKPPCEYHLQVGPNKIGSSLSEDIRIKLKNKDVPPISCVINVKDNGLATLENTCKHTILLNGSKMTKVHVLKNNDTFIVAEKKFQYVNDRVPTKVPTSIKVENRQSVMPSFKMKTVSRIPLSTKKATLRRSLSAVKTKTEASRRSCASALPEKRRSRLFHWETIATPSNQRLPRPSTSMRRSTDLSISVRRSLFLKNKGDVSFSTSRESVTSLIALEDSVCSVSEESLKSARGLKRRRESSLDSISNVKRRKHSADRLLILSVSDSESLFEDSDASNQESPLTNTLLSILNKVNSPKSPLIDIKGVKKLMQTPKVQKSPKNDLSDVRGVKKLMKTPKVQKSPLNDLTDVKGVKKILRTPKVQKSPKNDLTEVKGIKKLMKTPKEQKPPNNDLTDVRGVKRLMKTPKDEKSPVNDLSDVRGVKKLMKTPRTQKSPLNDLRDVRGVKKLLRTPKDQKSPLNDLTNVSGVKKLMKTPKIQKSPMNDLTNVGGVKKLMKTPKIQKSPINDLTNVSGVKKLMKTPKVQKSPMNDLRNVSGVKRLMKTPEVPKSPVNDLTQMNGVKKLFRTPKVQKSPVNDLTDVTGIKKILATPKVQKLPLNDLSNISAVKKILKTPRVQKPPKNDLTDVRGVKDLLGSPKVQKPPKNDLSNVEGVKELMDQTIDETLEKAYHDSFDDRIVHNSTASTPVVVSDKLPGRENVQLSQRGRRIRKKVLDDDFVESPKPKTMEGGRLRKRSQRGKTVDEQISVISLSTPNLETEEPVEMPLQKRGRGKKSAAEEQLDLVEEGGGSPNVTETVEVRRRGGRGRAAKNDDEPVANRLRGIVETVPTEISKNEEEETPSSIKRNTRGNRRKETVEKEVVKRGRGRRRKISEESSVTEDEAKKEESAMNEEIVEIPSVKRGRGRRAKINEPPAIEQSEEAKKNAIDEEHNEIQSKGRGRPRKKLLRDESLIAEEVKNGPVEEEVKQKRRPVRGQKKKIVEAEENQAELLTEEDEVVKQKRPTRGGQRKKNAVVEENKVDTPKVTNTRNRRNLTEDIDVPKEKKTRGEKRKNVEENVESNGNVDVNGKEIEDDSSPVKTRRGRGAKKSKDVVEISKEDNNVQAYPTRRRGRK